MMRLRGRFECFLMISLEIKSYVLRQMRGLESFRFSAMFLWGLSFMRISGLGRVG